MNFATLTNVTPEELKIKIQKDAWELARNAISLKTQFSDDLRMKALMAVPTTDLDMAMLFGRIYKDQFCFIPEGKHVGTWYAWDGTIWVKIESRKFGSQLARGGAEFLERIITGDPYYQEDDDLNTYVATIARHEDPKKTNPQDEILKNIRKYAKVLRSSNGLSNLETQLNIELEKPADFFDHDTDFVVFADGSVRYTKFWNQGYYAPHPARPVARKLGVSPSQVDTSPQAWPLSLSAWQPDVETQKSLQVAAGAALLGQGTAKNIICIYGESNTGKSTYARVLAHAFGGYAGNMAPNGIEQKMGTNWEQSNARGKRFLLVEEPSNRKTDDSFLKNLSGGGSSVRTEDKGKDPVEWTPQCVMHMTSNVKPNINTEDLAMVKRLNFVEFKHVFEYGQDEPDENYDETLFGISGGAVLNWILEGAEEYLRLGRIPLSQAIIEDANDNVEEKSSAMQWVRSMLDNAQYHNGCTRLAHVSPTDSASKFMVRSKGYRAYKFWCVQEGLEPVALQRWVKDVEGVAGIRGGKSVKSNGEIRVRGFALEHETSTRQCPGVGCPINLQTGA